MDVRVEGCFGGCKGKGVFLDVRGGVGGVVDLRVKGSFGGCRDKDLFLLDEWVKGCFAGCTAERVF